MFPSTSTEEVGPCGVFVAAAPTRDVFVQQLRDTWGGGHGASVSV